jgi:hypothetical protein
MYFHSVSERSVGKGFLIHARVANYCPTSLFHTVSEGRFCEVEPFVAPLAYACASGALLTLKASGYYWSVKLFQRHDR